MMGKPEYLAPQTLEEALETLARQSEGVKIIAGGTDLIPRLRSGILRPNVLVDLRKLPLDRIETRAGWMHIGARATHTDLLTSELFAYHCPALVEAAKEIAGPPIRNRGTVGGNLVNASPAADLSLPLLVYDACVMLVKAGSQREVLLEDFFTGPGQTVITADEILTEICLPMPPSRTSSSFIKLGKRKAMAIAVSSVATRLTLDADGKIAQARIALGSVAPRPLRAKTAESLLINNAPGIELFAGAAHAASMESSPISDLRASADYRKQMVAVLTRRSLLVCWQRLERENDDGNNSAFYCE
jgi:carbon-monoxide dehydrogenase medium subunit